MACEGGRRVPFGVPATFVRLEVMMIITQVSLTLKEIQSYAKKLEEDSGLCAVWGEQLVEGRFTSRREYFRLPFIELPATMQIVEIGRRKITIEPRSVRIIDASGGGLCVKIEDDLPLRRGLVAQFDFMVGSHSFSFCGIFVWKFDDRICFQYGVNFLDVDEQSRGMLVSTLGRIQVERNAKAKKR